MMRGDFRGGKGKGKSYMYACIVGQLEKEMAIYCLFVVKFTRGVWNLNVICNSSTPSVIDMNKCIWSRAKEKEKNLTNLNAHTYDYTHSSPNDSHWITCLFLFIYTHMTRCSVSLYYYFTFVTSPLLPATTSTLQVQTGQIWLTP